MEGYKSIDNPYTMQFGAIPKKQYIKRQQVTDEIVLNFKRNIPTYRGIFITGVRGCGKTVLMGKIRDTVAKEKNEKGIKDWITVTLEPDGNLIDSLARALYRNPMLKDAFLEAEIDFSVLQIGLKLKRAKLIASDEKDALIYMLDVLKKLELKVLVCIDEVTSTKDVAAFSHMMSSLANQDYDIYVLMTGLTSNIEKIQNKPDLTFLYRAKKYNLETLNITLIRQDYQKTLGLSFDDASYLANITKGYSFAYQVIGFYYWEELCMVKSRDNIKLERILENIDGTLYSMAYDKIWSEQNSGSKNILIALKDLQKETGIESQKVENIRNKIDMTSDTFGHYRDGLLNNSILISPSYGFLAFSLPRFYEYVDSVK